MLGVETGQRITLCSGRVSCVNTLLVEKFGDQVLLAEIQNPYLRLTFLVAPNERNCTVGFLSGAPNKSNLFRFIETSPGVGRIVSNVKSKNQDTPYSLAITTSGEYAALEVTGRDIPSYLAVDFQIMVTSETGVGRSLFIEPYPFLKWQSRRFFLEGYLHLSDIADKTDVISCIAVLNHELGRPGKVIDGGVQSEHGLGKLPGDLSNCAAVRALVSGKVLAVVEAVMGKQSCDTANLSAQVAFRFPEKNTTGERKEWVWHTDGLRQGQSHGFSLLLGICLSEVTGEDQGNLTVWPGSHLLLHQCKLPPHGALDLPKLEELTRCSPSFQDFRSCGAGAHALPALPASAVETGAPPDTSAACPGHHQRQAQAPHHDNEPALPGLGEPLQLKMRVGDIVLLHPDLAHCGAPNRHHELRRMLYFRLRHRTAASSGARKDPGLEGQATGRFQSWEELEKEHESDMWCDLSGVRASLGDEMDRLLQIFRA